MNLAHWRKQAASIAYRLYVEASWLSHELQLRRLRRILRPDDFNAGLDLADGHCRQMQVALVNPAQPGDHSNVRLLSAQFGHDVRVEQVHRSDGGRRTATSPAARRHRQIAARRISQEQLFEGGCADCCNRFQSPMGTSTAASSPRRVTTCGPSRTQVSRNSLNRAFASCTGQCLSLMDARYQLVIWLVKQIHRWKGSATNQDFPFL